VRLPNDVLIPQFSAADQLLRGLAFTLGNDSGGERWFLRQQPKNRAKIIAQATSGHGVNTKLLSTGGMIDTEFYDDFLFSLSPFCN